jgi:beta-lactamase regulating signal transducer with metallopeptidase domain
MILQAFIRGAIVIAIAGLLATLFRHRSAALRHHVWATAVLVQLSLLAFLPVLPKIHLPVIPTVVARIDQPVANTVTKTDANTENTSTRTSTSTSPSVNPSPRPSPRPRPLKDYLLIAWAIGAALVMARYIVGTLIMMRIALKGTRIEDGEWLTLAQRTARELGITRPVTMIWGDRVAVPITWGVLYPMILLPTSAHDWPADRRRFVLVHEMAHVKRFDALTQLIAQFTTAVFWFSPFVWLAEWRMRVEREHACDDTVIEHGTEPTVYANELLQMVRSLVRRRTPQPAFAALAMARKSEFEGRMLAILDPERPRRVTGITSGVAFALLSVLIAAPLAALDPFAVNVATMPIETTPLAGKPAFATPAGAAQPCDFALGGEGTNVEVSEDGIEIRLRRDARCISGELSGPVRISPDETRILAVDPGGIVRVREAVPHRTIELMIEHNRRSGVDRSFTINGRRPDDDGRTEREWLARVLPELYAESGIDPQDRVMRMLKSNGLSATLVQIARITSASSRRAHYQALLAIDDWSPAELTRIRSAATESLKSSPNELAALRRSFTQPRPTNAQASAGTAPAAGPSNDVELMEEVLKGISSSYDLHMAMKSQLPGANREMLLMFARNAGRISSGYELANFLLAAKGNYLVPDDFALEDAWFTAAGKISSSGERGRALIGVLDHATNERVTLKILNAMNGMSSGYDKTVVLTEIAKKKIVTTPAARSAFLAQVNTLSSSVDRRTVLEALN